MKRKKQNLRSLKIGTFIDPLTDFGFKHLFGREPTKELLISFLNALFLDKKVIVDLEYNKNEQLGPYTGSRRMIFDLTCTGIDGEKFIIEVQRVHQKYFRDRALYYTSRIIHNQNPTDDKWNYSLKEVYFIGIMDSILEDSERDEYLHYIRLAYEKSGKEFYDKLGYFFIEIPKFIKSENELENDMDKWLFVLKNMSLLQKIPVILNTNIFLKLFDIAKVSNLKEEEYMNYEKDLMAAWDEYAIQETLKEEGREEGREEERKQLVRNALSKRKFSVTEIAELLGVSIEFVKKVKKEMNHN